MWPVCEATYSSTFWSSSLVVMNYLLLQRNNDLCSPGRSRIYIMTLATLAPYRNRGIGASLLKSLLAYFESNKDSKALETVDEIALHVQTSNADAVRFYERFGFENVGLVENYYKRIDPPHCYELRKKLR